MNQPSLFEDTQTEPAPRDPSDCSHPISQVELWNAHTGRCGECGAGVCVSPAPTTGGSAVGTQSKKPTRRRRATT